MHIALTLQYFPADADPIPVHASADPQLIRAFRCAVLDEAHQRAHAAGGDAAAQLIERAEEERLRQVLDLLVPEQPAS